MSDVSYTAYYTRVHYFSDADEPLFSSRSRPNLHEEDDEYDVNGEGDRMSLRNAERYKTLRMRKRRKIVSCILRRRFFVEAFFCGCGIRTVVERQRIPPFLP